MTDAAIISSRGVLRDGSTRACGDVRVAGAVDDAARKDRLATRLALGDDAAYRAVLENRRDEQAMQHRLDAGLLHERIGDPLEHLGVEGVADRLRLRHGGAHRLGALLELDADALAVHRLLVAIPGEALDADLGDVAPEAAIALEQRGARAGARGGERRGQATRSAPHDQHLGLVDDVDLARGLGDALHRCAARQSIGFTSGTTTSQATSPNSATPPERINAVV